MYIRMCVKTSLYVVLAHVISYHAWRQVNADVVDMVRLSNGQFVKFRGSTKSVGRFISTKAVGSDERHDITHQYKYPEGTAELHVHTHIDCTCKEKKKSTNNFNTTRKKEKKKNHIEFVPVEFK